MKILASTLAVLAVLAPQAAAKPGHAQPLMAVVTRGHTQLLTALDGLTLEPLAPGRTVGRDSATILARSPGGGRVALLSDWRWFSVVDLTRGRVTRKVDVGEGGIVAGLWARPNRLAVLDAGGGVYSVTLGRRTILNWHPIDGDVVSWTKTSTRLLALVAPRGQIGAAKLAVADDAGNIRTVDLPGVVAGQAAPQAGDERMRSAVPALAVDPSRTRVAIVQKPGPPVVVDLSTLAVSGRMLAVARKLVSGYERTATWFAPNLIAVTGRDGSGGEQWTPAGLTVFDLHDGSARRVEDGVFHTLLAGSTLLACGQGLTAYGGDGSPMFHALDSEVVSNVTAVGPYAYTSSDGHSYSVLDTLTGQIVTRTATPFTTTIVGGW